MAKLIREKIPQEILLQNKSVPYTLILSSRARRMSIKIGQETGLEVVVPKRFNVSKVPRFMHEKEDWILKHLQKAAVKKSKKPKFQDGITVKVLGVPKTIRILPTRKKRPYAKEAKMLKYASDTAYYDGEEIIIYLPKYSPIPETPSLHLTSTQLTQAKATLEKHLRKEAKKFFTRRTGQIAEHMNLTYNRISIKAQKTRWGSCSRDKNLNFNWRLILTPIEVVDSIIIHELAHLKYLNHGVRFYKLVEKYCPNHKKLSKKLRDANFMI